LLWNVGVFDKSEAENANIEIESLVVLTHDKRYLGNGLLHQAILSEGFKGSWRCTGAPHLRPLDPMICPACTSEGLMIDATIAPQVQVDKSFEHNRVSCQSYQRPG
jgi:hypothetical protein